MDALLLHYEQQKKQYSRPGQTDTRMLRSIDMGWFILDKYYNLSDEAPVYTAAVLLDPRKRSAYIRQNWPEAWYEPALVRSNTIWKEYYDTASTEELDNISMVTTPNVMDSLAQLMMATEVKSIHKPKRDDFTVFVMTDPMSIEDLTPLQWWCHPNQ
ncbi:hypothetical protein K402DRAFT_342637 [Aulographum hederae CBS 113979]|uniref:Uncharacterized protein n=1 Tax=Aulographum hederae CBS 113979 TaxID=1176131 RepID=A0A6G1GK97_9PEZI|nr:hypothetical protein K402DRAFT_342637 [Aulographum hederae CBS 113979]